MQDRREHIRGKVIFGAFAKGDASVPHVPCVVRNISQSGASVEFPAAATLPDRISIAIPKTGRSFLGKIIWWRGRQAGIAFHAPASDSPAPALDLEERLRISERKARALKQRVKQLLGEG
jgi:hypothetical protein